MRNLITQNTIMFRKTKIHDHRTRIFISYLIEKEFLSIPPDAYFYSDKTNDLIKTALNLGLTELAATLTQDQYEVHNSTQNQ